MLNVIMLSVVMLSVITLNVVAPLKSAHNVVGINDAPAYYARVFVTLATIFSHILDLVQIPPKCHVSRTLIYSQILG
jgi:hypothetical protein